MPGFEFRPLLGEPGLLCEFGFARIRRPVPSELELGLPSKDVDPDVTFGFGVMRITGLGVNRGSGGCRVTVGGAD